MKYFYNERSTNLRLLDNLSTTLNQLWYKSLPINKEVEGADKLLKDLLAIAKEAERIYGKYGLKNIK